MKTILSAAALLLSLSSVSWGATGVFNYGAGEQAFEAASVPTAAQLTGGWAEVGSADDQDDNDQYDANGLGSSLVFGVNKSALDGSQLITVYVDKATPSMAVALKKDGAAFDTGRDDDTMNCRIVKATNSLLCYTTWNQEDGNDDYTYSYDVYVRK